MLEIALKESKEEKLDIKYQQGDAMKSLCQPLGKSDGYFDIVNACWVINHMSS